MIGQHRRRAVGLCERPFEDVLQVQARTVGHRRGCGSSEWSPQRSAARRRRRVLEQAGRLGRRCSPPSIDPRPLDHRFEVLGGIAHRLGDTEHEHSVLVERVVHRRQDPLLQFGFEIDEQIATGDDVETGEWWISDDVVRREHHHLPDPSADLEVRLGSHEEPVEPLSADVGGDRKRIDACPGPLDRVRIDVGGEDPQGERRSRRQPVERLQEGHRQRVGLFACRARRCPGAERAAVGVCGEQRGQDPVAQLRPHLGVAEEARHPDHQFAVQPPDLGRVLAQEAQVVRQLVELLQRHPPLDPADDRTRLVERHVVAGGGVQQFDDLVEVGLVDRAHLDPIAAAPRASRRNDPVHMLEHPGRQLADRRNHVGHIGSKRTPRHPVERRRVRVLDERDPPAVLDGLQPKSAVRAHTRQDHADTRSSPLCRQRSEQHVDREAQPSAGLRFAQPQPRPGDAQVAVGRDDVHPVGSEHHAFGRLGHQQPGRPL